MLRMKQLRNRKTARLNVPVLTGHTSFVVAKINRGYYMAARRYEISLRVLKNIFQHENRNFVSPSGHVMFYLLYKHQ